MDADKRTPTWMEATSIAWLLLSRTIWVPAVWLGFYNHFVRDSSVAGQIVLIALFVGIGLVYWIWVVQMAFQKQFRGFRIAIVRTRAGAPGSS